MESPFPAFCASVAIAAPSMTSNSAKVGLALGGWTLLLREASLMRLFTLVSLSA